VPAEITEELKRFGKAGVPLVLVYPRDPTKAAIELPAILTQSIVLDALDKASN
jgi:thiol:disulfide interchange protein